MSPRLPESCGSRQAMGREGFVCAGADAHDQISGADRDCLFNMFSKLKDVVG